MLQIFILLSCLHFFFDRMVLKELLFTNTSVKCTCTAKKWVGGQWKYLINNQAETLFVIFVHQIFCHDLSTLCSFHNIKTLLHQSTYTQTTKHLYPNGSIIARMYHVLCKVDLSLAFKQAKYLNFSQLTFTVCSVYNSHLTGERGHTLYLQKVLPNLPSASLFFEFAYQP